MMRDVLFTDADNTLWETDAVYARSQLGLLRGVEQVVGARAPDSVDEGLAYLRVIDQGIAAQHPAGLRYPPVLLAHGLALVLSGTRPEDAVRHSMCEQNFDRSLIPLVERYSEETNVAPELRPGVRETLKTLQWYPVSVIIVTETSLRRCTATLRAHELDALISAIVAETKTPELYRRIRVGHERPMMVGDQIDRDVEYSRQAGYETVFYPGGFTPLWTADSRFEPDHEIARYDRILDLM